LLDGTRVDIDIDQFHRCSDLAARPETKIEEVVFQPIEEAVVRQERPQKRDWQEKQIPPVKPGPGEYRHGPQRPSPGVVRGTADGGSGAVC
jgi:hypothetical protein